MLVAVIADSCCVFIVFGEYVGINVYSNVNTPFLPTVFVCLFCFMWASPEGCLHEELHLLLLYGRLGHSWFSLAEETILYHMCVPTNCQRQWSGGIGWIQCGVLWDC